MTKNRGRKKCEKTQTFKTAGEAYKVAQKIPQGRLGLGTAHTYYCGKHKGYHFTTRARY